MTRWGMVADLRRCVGCQTCTAACKHTNATPPSVQWRRVLDLKIGEYPDVSRAFVPVGCMHCADPPCMHVCPSTATGQREDGIVTIDYDLCIGCAYCAVACPYQARYKVDKPRFAYGGNRRMRSEAAREDPARLGVAQKCTFCSDRIDYGLAHGLTPGIDPDATPACVNSCIADALHFGDLADPDSNVSTLIKENRSFRMHEELGTDSGFHYVWSGKGADEDAKADAVEAALVSVSRGTGSIGGADPWLQFHWDWRAAGNFIGGGSGAGLLAATAVAAFGGMPAWPFGIAGVFGIALGLFLVWLETGRPMRAPLNVFFHPETSWMTREAMVAILLLPAMLLALWLGSPWMIAFASLIGLGFLFCQGRILHAAKGIPAWRHPRIVPLIFATGLAEGLGLAIAIGTTMGYASGFRGLADASSIVLALLVAVRFWAYGQYRKGLKDQAPAGALKALRRTDPVVLLLGHVVPLALIAVAYFQPTIGDLLLALAGAATALGGWYLKFVIVTRAAYNQGFAIDHAPDRGPAGAGPGAKPGWSPS